MSECIKIAFPERLGKYGALDFVKERLCIDVDLSSRKLCQRIGKYEVTIMDSRTVTLVVDELGFLTGITGEDWFYDYQLGKPDTKLRIVEKLPFGYATIVAFNNSRNLDNIKRALSPYENILINYLRENNLDAKIYSVRGKTEGLVKSGAIDLGIDNTNTGNTMTATGLKIAKKIRDTQAIIISKEKDVDFVKELWGLK